MVGITVTTSFNSQHPSDFRIAFATLHVKMGQCQGLPGWGSEWQSRADPSWDTSLLTIVYVCLMLDWPLRSAAGASLTGFGLVWGAALAMGTRMQLPGSTMTEQVTCTTTSVIWRKRKLCVARLSGLRGDGRT